ncbi:MAG: hypothetical protein HY000_36735 [Planctomycetes bacterium]|nr:hypothetical protein [Planctomycetota bacterium]
MGKLVKSQAKRRADRQTPREATSRAALPSLVLSGQRDGAHYLVYLHGRPVPLTAGTLATLCELIEARCTTGIGFVRLSPVAIWRLRQAIRRAVGVPKALASSTAEPRMRIG